MNEWVLTGIVVVGTVIALGGGGWIVNNVIRRKDKA